MNLRWPASLRARLVTLVVICTLPAMAVMSYTAFEHYYTSLTYAYGIGKLASDDLVARYQDLSSRSRSVLALMAQLPAVNAPTPECDRSLATLRAQMPLYANLGVVTLDGEFHCSAAPFARPLNVARRDWFRQVLATRRFVSGVIPHGHITGRSLLIFSAPHFDAQGKLIGTLTAVVSPELLAPPAGEVTLARYGEITIFSADGSVLLRYPNTGGFLGSDQSRSPLFRALQAPAPENGHPTLSGPDGKTRIFALRRVTTDVPDQPLFIASGIDRTLLRDLAFVPLARDLGIIAFLALLIIAGAWWLSSVFVIGGLRPVLRVLQRLGEGDWSARTGIGARRGELGVIARGVDSMADNLQTRIHIQHAAERARESSERRFEELIEMAVEGITVRRVTGEYILVNQAFCKMVGYSRDELLRMRITDLIEPSEQRGHLLEPGESAKFESWMYHKDGHRVSVEVSTLRLPNGDIQSVQRNISERLEAQRALQESERHYRELVEQSLFGILVRRVTGEILFVNRTLCQMTGYRREELVGMHISRLVDPAEAEAIHRVQRVTRGENLQFRSRLVHKNGSIIHEELSARRLDDGNIQVIISDITARVETEQRFTAERQFALHALDVLPGVFFVVDADGRFLRWNRQLEDVTGYSMEELKQIRIEALIPPERRAAHHRNFAAILAGTGLEGESLLLCKDGRRIPTYYIARGFEWQGRPCLVGMDLDISARKQAEKDLQEERGLLSQAINSLPGLFTLCTDQGRFLRWNRRLEELSGYSAEELRSLRPLDLIAPEQRGLLAKHIAEVFASGKSSVEADFLCRDGRRLPHYFTGQRLQLGGQACLAGVALDISARKQAEQRAHIYLQELEQLSNHLLQVLENERRDLARELHDELGQGLATALLMLKDLESGTPHKLRAEVGRTGAMLTQLSQQVRSLSLNLRPAILDDLGLAATLRWYLRERVAPSGLKVNLDMDPKLPRLSATVETVCFRVLQSALTNVLKHAEAREVNVSLHLADGELRLTVQDDGRGFDVAAARRRALAGQSFGLLGMEERVQLAGGRFTLSSRPDQGTQVEAVLPAAPQPGTTQVPASREAGNS